MSKVDKNKELYEKAMKQMKTKYESGDSFGTYVLANILNCPNKSVLVTNFGRLPDGCRV